MPDPLLPFLLRMKAKAKEARSRSRRVAYAPEDRTRAITLLQEVEGLGGTLEDAAELLSMHRVTLEGWLDWATTPTVVRVVVEVKPEWPGCRASASRR